MQKVIPPGLNYADIKPEAIENQVRMVKFTPIATVQDAQPNDIVRFHLQGNGFYDPYSAYIRIEVQINDIPDLAAEGEINGKFLDRSAHSLFSRLVIRSQGTELERIEQYDIMAAMVNDMIYSTEQRLLHHYEGFPHKQMMLCNLAQNASGTVSTNNINALPYLYPQSQQPLSTVGDYGVFKYNLPEAAVADWDTAASTSHEIRTGATCLDYILGSKGSGQPATIGDMFDVNANRQLTLKTVANLATAGFTATTPVANYRQIASPKTLVFTLPIYSGIIGVLMPEKKFIPMSLLPLEIEFTMNPHAFYPVGTLVTDRKYVVKKFEIWTHTLFFEQELHRSLEAVVAESGIFIHYNSFYLTPINTYSATQGTINDYNQLGVYLKSINALHWTFLYSSYETENGPRKLNFVSHNVTSLQLRNGMDLMPSEPVLAATGGDTLSSGSGRVNDHAQLLIELYKAWNKMHDPLSDAALVPFSYNLDNILTKPTTVRSLLLQQSKLGKCQYGLSLEGEELGQNKTIITGKKSVMPFDLNLKAYKYNAVVSYMMCFLRADFIIYVRPDLVVTRLGL